MKKFLIVFVVFLALFASAANAQFVSDQCYVSDVDISQTVEGTTSNVKITYNFKCDAGDAYAGQMTKMVVSLPVSGVRELKAVDSYGTMEVLEGPEYVSSKSGDGETKIGVIFRKGLLVTNQVTSYSVTIDFKTGSLVSKSEETYRTKPEDLVGNPKVTIVGRGITETTIPVQSYDYILDFEDKVSIQQITPASCQLLTGIVTCKRMEAGSMDNVEVAWSKELGVGEDLGTAFKKYTQNLLPKIADLFKRAVESTSEAVEEA